MESAPACFLLPQSWSKYYTSFRVALVKCDARAVPQLEQLSQRNRRIQISPLSLHQHLIQSSEYKLITLLDKKYINAGLEETTDACLSTLTNHGPLVTVALCWATCATRYGSARTYIVARLLRKWANRGVELERLIWAFLSSNYNWPQSQRSKVYRLLAELVHSKHLSVGRYLQWLMARGIMTAHKNSEGVRIYLPIQ